MNPFLAHSQTLAQYQAEVGGSVIYRGATLPAVVEPFTTQQMLRPDGGGLMPMLLSSAIVSKASLRAAFPPDGYEPKSLHAITVLDPFGTPHKCQIVEVHDVFTDYRIVVNDVSQNA